MTGPSLGGPQFFLQEVWEGGTPLKAGWKGKLFILHMTMKTVDTLGPPLPITRARIVTTTYPSYNQGYRLAINWPI